MLRDNHRDRAAALPWRVDRLYDTHALVTHTGQHPVDFVQAVVDARPPGRRRVAAIAHWGQMLPGETAELCVCAHDAHPLVRLLWFRPEDGAELTWAFRM
ncbi:hypothetical protein [Microbacterium luticocti]|uniref:hypothetical protein n=1 Tax=Microbacterium luticocti TaxID=451764 RepID=UPI00041446B6|nr:hypothetical protein [Microbacterium luticocti]